MYYIIFLLSVNVKQYINYLFSILYLQRQKNLTVVIAFDDFSSLFFDYYDYSEAKCSL